MKQYLHNLCRAHVQYTLAILLVVFLCLTPPTTVQAAEPTQEQVKELAQEKVIKTGAVVEQQPRPWWIGELITVFGIVIGALMIIYQLGKQHESSLNVQKENFREELRMKIYQEFSEAIRNIGSNISSSKTDALLIKTVLLANKFAIAHGVTPTPIKYSAIEFSKKHYAALNSITKLVFLFEKYEIVSPELCIFKTAALATFHDIEEAQKPLFQLFLKILPISGTDEHDVVHTLNIRAIDDNEAELLEQLSFAYAEAISDLSGYMMDLSAELQHTLLGKLFDNRIKSREPLDPSSKVITTEPNRAKELREYFENETAWGKHVQSVEREVTEGLNNSGGTA